MKWRLCFYGSKPNPNSSTCSAVCVIPPTPVGRYAGGQLTAIIKTASFHADAGLHALRYTFLTEAGRYTQNVRALQTLAGQSQIQTTMRYVHPDREHMIAIAGAVQRARKPSVTTIFTAVSEA